jgi:hypothetical protein
MQKWRKTKGMPLKQALGDPKLFHRYLQVEKIFGRRLIANPNVIIKNNPLIDMPATQLNAEYVYFGKEYHSATHELIHCEDIANMKENNKWSFKSKMSPLTRVWLEGRAVFGSSLIEQNKGKDYKIEKQTLKQSIVAGLTGATIGALSFGTLGAFLGAGFVGTVPLLIDWTYIKFNNSINKIARKINNPVKAFRMTEQRPVSWQAVFEPLKYYKEQIEKQQRQQRQIELNPNKIDPAYIIRGDYDG